MLWRNVSFHIRAASELDGDGRGGGLAKLRRNEAGCKCGDARRIVVPVDGGSRQEARRSDV